jgi:predicted unusual protein kinase regulating ubiquinone biosynthesis (AarF/ABC1/UbiB family)
LGDDGRVVFLDFGLMDRVDFGIMESCAAGVRQVLNKDWLDLTHTFQAAAGVSQLTVDESR